MHQHYQDILDRILEPPTWFDDDAVPRFGPFVPNALGNIYATEAALAVVSCQECGRHFRVAMSNAFGETGLSLGDVIRLRRVHYGDPPNIGCCPGGPTMNSIMHEVLEYWCRDLGERWRRDPRFEGPIAPGRLKPPDTPAEVLSAIDGGAQTIRVLCTSRPNQYDLAGRIVAAMSARQRVLLVFPEAAVFMVHKMLEGLVPDDDIGSWRDKRQVALASFSVLAKIRPGAIDQLVIMDAPCGRTDAAVLAYKSAKKMVARLTSKVCVEFAMEEASVLMESPQLIIDAGRSAHFCPI